MIHDLFFDDSKLQIFLLPRLNFHIVFTAKSLGIFRNKKAVPGLKKIKGVKEVSIYFFNPFNLFNQLFLLYLHLNHQLLNHPFPDHRRMHIFRVKNSELVIG